MPAKRASVFRILHPLDSFGLPRLWASRSDPGAPGNFAQAPVFQSLDRRLDGAVALQAGGWLADVVKQASELMPSISATHLNAVLDGLISVAEGRPRRVIRYWLSPAALGAVNPHDPAMTQPIVAVAWERTNGDRAMLLSAGYLVRLVQISMDLTAGHLTGSAVRALCRLNLATVTLACDRTELLDLIETALDFSGASKHEKFQFIARRDKLEETGTDTACGNSRTCSPNAAGCWPSSLGLPAGINDAQPACLLHAGKRAAPVEDRLDDALARRA